PTLTARAGTAVVVQVAYRAEVRTGTPGGEYAVLAWTVDVGHEGILDVYTLDENWWTVGTRDPGMAYELLIYKATGWVVEVVSGEEWPATDDLVASAPHDPRAGPAGWGACALVRPA